MKKQDEKDLTRVVTMGDSSDSPTAGESEATPATVSDIPSPLPWGVLFEDKRWFAMSGRYYVAKLIESPGAWDENGDQRHTPEANARLIVQCVNAFPHLVSALREAHEFISDAIPVHGEYILPKLEAALRLASEGSET